MAVSRASRGAPSRVPSGRVPPQNLDAERSLLGAMFISAEAVEVGLAKVAAEDFVWPSHRKVFAAMAQLHGRGTPIDHISVADRLEAEGDLENVGGKTYLLDLTGAVPTAANSGYYADVVKRTSMLRQLIEAATEVVEMGYEAPDDLDEIVEEAEKRIFEVTKKRVQSKFMPIDALLVEGFHRLEELSERQEHLTGVPSGFYDLDKQLAGLHRGDLIILAARPSVGKTALALNIAVRSAKVGTSVAVFSLEMSSEQLVQRLLCMEANIDSQRLRTGEFRESDWHLINQAMGRLSQCDLWVDDTPSMSILELRAKARRHLRDRTNGLIIVDYLQLMQPQARRSENRQTEIAEISRGLKILAKELNTPIIALSQLSRAVEQRPDKRPMLSDLRESGAIEQDADVVMFIHRDTRPRGVEDPEEATGGKSHYPPKGEAEVIISKHRNGPTGVVRLTYAPAQTRFGDATTLET